MRRILAATAVFLAGLLLTGAASHNVRLAGVDRGGRSNTGVRTITAIWYADGAHTTHSEWDAGADIYHEDTDGSIMAYDYGFYYDGQGEEDLAYGDWPERDSDADRKLWENWDDTYPRQPQTGTDSRAMFWFDLDRIPANATITEAVLCVALGDTNETAAYDPSGLHAVLDTLSADIGWLTGDQDGEGCDDCGDPRYRDVSWEYFDTDSSKAWVPHLDDRVYTWEWGVKSEPILAYDSDDDDELTFNVTESVQQYVSSGGTMANAGWWLFATNATETSNLRIIYGPNADADSKQPFLKVTYTTAPHSKRWFGYSLAFVFCTDDGNDENLTWQDSTSTPGHSYSAGFVEDFIDTDNRMTTAQVAAFSAGGMDAVSHSRWHGEYRVGGVLSYSTLDSTKFEIQRAWLDEITGTDTKTFFFPRHDRTLSTDSLCLASGYIAARGATYGDAPYYPNWGDPTNLVKWDKPINIMAVGMTAYINDLVGENNEEVDKEDIRTNLYENFISVSADSGYALIIVYTHLFKPDAAGGSTNGLDYNPGDIGDLWKGRELGWIYDCVAEHRDIGITDFSYAMEWYRSKHEPIDPPAWATEAISEGYTASDSLYWDLPD